MNSFKELSTVKTVLKFAPAIAMLAALGAQPLANAQTQKIATINMQQALAETADGKKAVADLRAKFGPKDQDFQRRSQELQATQDKLRKTQNTISEEAKTKLEGDIATMTRNLHRDSDDAKADMEQEEQKMVQELGGKIMQVINKYAADNQYAMVFDVSGQPNNIMFASAAVDITRDIIAMYDKAAPGMPPAAPPATSKAPSATAPRPAAATATPAPKPATPKP
jgi:outer membrane protein